MKTYGSEFKRLRKEAGLTQTQTGKALGMCPQFISRIENGSRHPLNESKTGKFLVAVGHAELLPHMMALHTAHSGNLTFDINQLPDWISAPLVRLYEVLLEDGMTPTEWSGIENIIDEYISQGVETCL